ncbi:MAG TPA: HD domain-containing phosphohydrolase [Clostridia bacterium]|nr:HD domain-containing phosphohydrolase [Clostridia bacterium]
MEKLAINKILTSLIAVIDENNYILKNHHRNVTVIAYNLAKAMNIPEKSMQKLLLAASIHDIGALHIEDAQKLIEIDIENPEKHQRIGSRILSSVKGFSDVAAIVNNHHIKYSEYTEEIPFECLILHLADRIDVLLDHEKPYLEQRSFIETEVNKRKDSIFEPKLVAVFNDLIISDIFWHDIQYKPFEELLTETLTKDYFIESTYENLKNIAIMFSRISDFRSKYFATHSIGVGIVSYELSKLLNLDEEKCQQLEIAGYLHDLGKLAIDSRVLSKNGKLTSDEFDEVKKHTYFTNKFLKNIDGFHEIAFIASAHHEKHDGKGYPYHLKKENFNLEIDILSVADIFCALRENRPYKNIYPIKRCIEIFETSFIKVLNEELIHLLINNIELIDNKRLISQRDARTFYLASVGELADEKL